MTYTPGQTFSSTKTANGETFVETAKIIRVTAHRVVYAWTVNGRLIAELSWGFKQFSNKWEA